MSARSKARKRAVDILFEADLRQRPLLDVLDDLERRRVAEQQSPLNAYVRDLVEGVASRCERIDELISTYSQGWTLDRMPAVDRNVLRVGVYELLWRDDVPNGVVIAEAVELAQELSTDASAPFVNGLLARIDRIRDDITL